jgi:general stress protein 26
MTLMEKTDSTQEMKTAFWQALAKSPFVMLTRDDDPASAAPMTAQLDKDANSAIWFFTSRDNRFAALGEATGVYAAKDHSLFARFAGTLVEEVSEAVKDRLWDNTVEAWFPKGKSDPNLLLIRMELGDASIWGAEMGTFNVIKMLLGQDVRHSVSGQHAETML